MERLSITPLTQADYLVEWSCEMKDDSVSFAGKIRLEMDDTTTLGQCQNAPIATVDFISISGFKKVKKRQ